MTDSVFLDRDEATKGGGAHLGGPLVATGLGGRLELSDGELRIVKGGVLGALVDLLWLAHGMMEKRIPLIHVTSVEIVRFSILPSVIRVTYAGSPPQTGSYISDALSENALVMNVIDNRAFYEIMARVVRSATAGDVRADDSLASGAEA